MGGSAGDDSVRGPSMSEGAREDGLMCLMYGRHGILGLCGWVLEGFLGKGEAIFIMGRG